MLNNGASHYFLIIIAYACGAMASSRTGPIIAGAGAGTVTVVASTAMGANIYAAQAVGYAANMGTRASAFALEAAQSSTVSRAVGMQFAQLFWRPESGVTMRSSSSFLETAEQIMEAASAVGTKSKEIIALETALNMETQASTATTTLQTAAKTAQAASEASETAVTAAAAATIATIVITIIVMIAIETMPYWLPKILKQSGIANNTLYEARAYIDFQGAVGQACSRATFHLYPYSRKDLGGRFWQEVGGDRGRSCLPERYTTMVYIPSRTLVTLKASLRDTAKHMKIFSIKPAQTPGVLIAFKWQNA